MPRLNAEEAMKSALLILLQLSVTHISLANLALKQPASIINGPKKLVIRNRLECLDVFFLSYFKQAGTM